MSSVRRSQRVELILLTLFYGMACAADPLNGSLESGASVSGNVLARNLFVNPAAFGFESTLNGASLTTSYTYGAQSGLPGELSTALGLGPVGLGLERFATAGGKTNRWSFGAGVQLAPSVFAGTRLSLVRPESTAGTAYESVDLGMQYRPARWLALGLMWNRINRPAPGGVALAGQWVTGATLRPLDWLDLSIDLDAQDRGPARMGYQASVTVEVVPGLRIRGGYHRDYLWQAGLEVRLGPAALTAAFQPGAARRGSIGFYTAPLPFRSQVGGPPTLALEIDEELDETGRTGGLFVNGRRSFLDVLTELERAETDGSVNRVVVRLKTFPLGLAAAEELHLALARVRKSGRKIEVFMARGGIREYLIAASADRIHMDATGELTLVGVKSERYYLKGTLDKLGVEGQLLAKGEYKSAAEMFTRKGASSASREATMQSLEAIEGLLIAALDRSRGINAEKWAKITRTALFGAEDALAAGLIDSIAGFEAREEKVVSRGGARGSLRTWRPDLALPRRVAVVVADGDLVDKRWRLLQMAGSGQTTPDTFGRQLRRAIADPLTAAVVVRVSSPGGDILASHKMAEAIRNAREEKPVVVSMGDAAASGGYYIATPATRIFAGPLTLTGSIGVILGKVSLEGLFKKIDLQKEILSRSPYAGLYSEARGWSADEQKIVGRRLEQYYDGFVSHVARARGIPVGEVESSAKGRVWLGTQARERKLVDELGGYREAVAFAAAAGGIEAGLADTWIARDSLGLSDLLEQAPWAEAPPLALDEILGRDLARMTAESAWFRERPYQYRAEIGVR